MATTHLITPDGMVTSDEYSIDGSSDRGLLLVTNTRTKSTIKVHKKRLFLRINSNDGVLVINDGTNFWAKCPKCNKVVAVKSDTATFKCDDHGVFDLLWKDEERPMTTETVVPAARQRKKKEQPTPVDIQAIVAIPNMRLYRKSSPFDVAKTAVVSYHLLYVGDDKPRKICFNTYNGNLGKDSKDLPIDRLVNNEMTDKDSWYSVQCVKKAEAKLVKSGYELVE